MPPVPAVYNSLVKLSRSLLTFGLKPLMPVVCSLYTSHTVLDVQCRQLRGGSRLGPRVETLFTVSCRELQCLV